MKTPKLPRWTRVVPVVAAAGLVATFAVTRESIGSDHMDTPLTELNPRLDINDVYAFPGSSDDRIAIAVTLSSPLGGSSLAAHQFDPNALYQIHVDNNQDGVEDVVFQFSFDSRANGTQTVDVIGPVPPARASGIQDSGSESYNFSRAAMTFNDAPLGSVRSGAIPASGRNMQFFAGVRDDPFYIDLEQFFRILPDRRPTQGALSQLGPQQQATAFRPNCGTGTTPPANSAPFDARFGCARDFLAGFNALAIVVEVPEADLTFNGARTQLGVWATISR